MKTVLVLGATSSIAREISLQLGAKGYSLYLASRDEKELERIAKDLEVRTQASIQYAFFDALQLERSALFFQQVLNQVGRLDGVVIALGDLGDHLSAIHNYQEAERIIKSNFLGIVAILTPIADYFEKEKSGFILALSSVAGDRGRAMNYVYGSSKGALSLFLQGLRNRLFNSYVHVLTVKLGRVDTAMTFGKVGDTLLATPQNVASKIVKALEKHKEVVYIPGYWRVIMGIISLIPEKIFKRLNI